MTKFSNRFKDFLRLTKFEIVVFEVITFVAGYLIGQPIEQPLSWQRMVISGLGIAALALGSGAMNQIQEREEDSQMDRTRDRPLPSGRISVTQAIVVTAGLFIVGTLLLASISTSLLILGWAAVFSYNVLYTLWWKPKMAFGAIPGAIPGALPILAGFHAAGNPVFDVRGIFLFFILFFWQMPHFWVLALKYSNDYDQGGFPTLPVSKGVGVTRFQITLWCLAYAGLGLLSLLFFPLGIPGAIGGLFISIWLIYELLRFLRSPETKTWLRFFLAINFSMILYLFVITVDLWSIYLHPRS